MGLSKSTLSIVDAMAASAGSKDAAMGCMKLRSILKRGDQLWVVKGFDEVFRT